MDKIKPLFQWLFRNRFWVTCALVAVASLATWYFAWTDIEKKRSQRASSLNSSNMSIDGVIKSEVVVGDGENDTVAVHPNTGTKSGMEERIEAAGNAALDAWKARHDKQKALLQVAEVLPSQIRGPLTNHDPMEKPIETELLSETQRYTFRNYITRQMPKISEKIKNKWPYDETGEKIKEIEMEASKRSSISRDGDLAVAKDLVRWHADNQQLWNEKSTQFQGFNGNPSVDPTSQQMLALQQDLWILEGIFDAIAEVNKGFTANDLAPVERIDHVLVGPEAINNEVGSLIENSYVPPSSSSSSAGGGAKKGGGVQTKKQRRKANRGNQREKSKSKSKKAVAYDPGESSSPFHGRYVDRDFTRLNESSITKVLTSTQLTDQSYLAVAKRVPVRIAVKMDERRINDFLAAAANSPFAFEIRQIRINKHTPGEGVERKADSIAGKKKSKKDERGGIGLGGGTGGGTSADGNSKRGGRGGGVVDAPFGAEVRSNFDIKVEFIGIVKIYNPVRKSLIFPDKKGNAADDSE